MIAARTSLKSRISLKFKVVCLICAITLVTSLFPIQSVAYASEQINGTQETQDSGNVSDDGFDLEDQGGGSENQQVDTDTPSDVEGTSTEDVPATDPENIDKADIEEDYYDWVEGDIEGQVDEYKQDNKEYEGSFYSVSDYNSMKNYFDKLGDLYNDDSDSSYESIIGDGSENNPFKIRTAEEYCRIIRDYCTTLQHDKPTYVSLENDIYLDFGQLYENGYEDGWKYDFQGVLMGNNHMISLFQGDSRKFNRDYDNCAGLFNELKDKAIIRDLDLYQDIKLEDKDLIDHSTGVLANKASGNVEISGCNVGGSIDLQKDENVISFNLVACGGFLGRVYSDATINFSNDTNSVSISTNIDQDQAIGGFVGASDDAHIITTNCSNNQEANMSATPGESWVANFFINLTGILINIGFSVVCSHYKQKEKFYKEYLERLETNRNDALAELAYAQEHLQAKETEMMNTLNDYHEKQIEIDNEINTEILVLEGKLSEQRKACQAAEEALRKAQDDFENLQELQSEFRKIDFKQIDSEIADIQKQIESINENIKNEEQSFHKLFKDGADYREKLRVEQLFAEGDLIYNQKRDFELARELSEEKMESDGMDMMHKMELQGPASGGINKDYKYKKVYGNYDKPAARNLECAVYDVDDVAKTMDPKQFKGIEQARDNYFKTADLGSLSEHEKNSRMMQFIIQGDDVSKLGLKDDDVNFIKNQISRLEENFCRSTQIQQMMAEYYCFYNNCADVSAAKTFWENMSEIIENPESYAALKVYMRDNDMYNQFLKLCQDNPHAACEEIFNALSRKNMLGQGSKLASDIHYYDLNMGYDKNLQNTFAEFYAYHFDNFKIYFNELYERKARDLASLEQLRAEFSDKILKFNQRNQDNISQALKNIESFRDDAREIQKNLEKAMKEQSYIKDEILKSAKVKQLIENYADEKIIDELYSERWMYEVQDLQNFLDKKYAERAEFAESLKKVKDGYDNAIEKLNKQINESINVIGPQARDALAWEYRYKLDTTEGYIDAYQTRSVRAQEAVNNANTEFESFKQDLITRETSIKRNFKYNYSLMNVGHGALDINTNFKYLTKSFYSGVNWFYSCAESLSSACSALPMPEGGYSKDHVDSYAGGLIGYYEGDNSDKSMIVVDNFVNCGTITAGYDAGGLVGYVSGSTLAVNNVSNYGNISVTDYGLNPSAGGLVGVYSSSSSKVQCIVDRTNNFGSVLSRESSAGVFGTVESCSTDIRICNTGVACGIGGEDSLGGFIGYLPGSNFDYNISFINCYSACIFDSTTLGDTSIGLSKIPGLGFKDITVYNTSESYDEDNVAGSFIGQWVSPDAEKITVSNCCYNEGYNLFGSDFDCKNILEYVNPEFHKYNLNQFATGEVCHQLNNGSLYNNQFGQFIDDYSNENFERQWIPVAGLSEQVYKDDFNAQIVYTNYNPRTIKLNHIYFSANYVDIDPAVSVINVKDGTNFVFKACPNNGYKLDNIEVVNYPKEYGSEPGDSKKIEPFYTDEDGVLYFGIENITTHVNVIVKGVEIEPKQPEGLGTLEYPYQVKSREHLLWANKAINDNFALSICVDICNDIDCSNIDWKPLGLSNNGLGYRGHFNGKGHTLYNLSSSAASENAFFACINGGCVDDLNINGSFNDAGLVYYACKADIEGCSYSGTLNSNGPVCGGLVAIGCGVSLIECKNYASINYSCSNGGNEGSVGGLIGLISGLGYMYRDDIGASKRYDVGLDGYVSDKSMFANEVSGCTNNGSINFSSTDWAFCGGLIGRIGPFRISKYEGDFVENAMTQETSDGTTYELEITSCINKGNISGSSNYSTNLSAGGLCGGASNVCVNARFNYCANYGNIGCDGHSITSSIKHVGGWIGEAWNRDYVSWKFSNSMNTGNLYSYEGAVGNAVGLYGTHFNDNGWRWDFWNTHVSLSASNLKFDNCALTGIVDTVNDNLLYANKIGEVIGSYEEDNWFAITDWSANKLYCVDVAGVDQVGGDGAYGGNIIDNLILITNDDITGGSLAYRLNGHPTDGSLDEFSEFEDDRFLQNLGEIGKYDLTGDATPYLNITDDKATKDIVYPNKIDKKRKFIVGDVDYINQKPTVEDDSVYISFICEGSGSFEGPSFIKKGENAKFIVVPSYGYTLVSIYDGDDQYKENLYDGSGVFNVENVSKDKIYRATFSYNSELKEDESGTNTYCINNEIDLRIFANRVNKGENINAVLKSNIDINSLNFVSIGTDDKPFKGTFDGCGYEIRSDSTKPLFGSVSGADIKNFDLICSIIDSEENSVLISNAEKCTISDVSVLGELTIIWTEDDADEHELQNFGCFVGQMDKDAGEVQLLNCVSSLNFNARYVVADSSFYACSAFVGNMEGGSLTSYNCASNGSMIVGECDEDVIMGGLIGYIHYNVSKLDIYGFTNSGTLTSPNYAGSIVGKIDWMDKCLNALIAFSLNEGKITADDNCAGFIGSIESAVKDDEDNYSTIKFVACQNSGDIIGYDNACGGFVGRVNDKDMILNFDTCINLCNNLYTSDDENNYVGGFLGWQESLHADGSSISNCFSYIRNPRKSDSHDRSKSFVGFVNNFLRLYDDSFKFTNNYILNGDPCENVKCDDDDKSGGFKQVSKDDISYGKLGYLMSENFNFNNENIYLWTSYIHNTPKYNDNVFAIGQTLDFNGLSRSASPRICDYKVYSGLSCGIEFYTNYVVSDSDSLTGFSPEDNSKAHAILLCDNKDYTYSDHSKEIELPGDLQDNKLYFFHLESSDMYATLNSLKICGEDCYSEIDYSSSTLTLSYKTIYEIVLKKLNEGTVPSDAFTNPLYMLDVNEYLSTHGLVINYGFGYDIKPKTYIDAIGREFSRVTNAHELYWFMNYVNNTNEGKSANMMLENDIDMKPYNWKSLCSSGQYSGIIDGKGHTIYNLYCTEGGFIRNASNAQILNINLNVNINKNDIGCVIVNSYNCLLNNVSVDGFVTGSDINTFGGIVGCVRGNSSYKNNFIMGSEDTLNYLGSRIYNCTCNVIFSPNSFAQNALSGGIVAKFLDNSVLNMYNCINNAKVYSTKSTYGVSSNVNWAGGICGYMSCAKSKIQIECCINKAEILGYYAGGILAGLGGYSSSPDTCTVDISYSENHGSVSGVKAGGVCSSILDTGANSKVNVKGTINWGNILSNAIGNSKSEAGGAFAYIDDSDVQVNMTNFVNYGDVSAYKYAGGFYAYVNRISTKSLVDASLSWGEVNSFGYSEFEGSYFAFLDCWDNHVEISNSHARAYNCSEKQKVGKGTDDEALFHGYNSYEYADKFRSGQICYQLNGNGKQNGYVQIIDDYSFGDKMYCPVLKEYFDRVNPIKGISWSNKYPYVYKKDDGTYSNFDNTSDYVCVKVEHDDSATKAADKSSYLGTICKLDDNGLKGSDIEGTNYVEKGKPFIFCVDAVDGSVVESVIIIDNETGETKSLEYCDTMIYTVDNVSHNLTIRVKVTKFMMPPKNAEGKFLLSNYSQLLWYADYVNYSSDKGAESASCILQKDIFCSQYGAASWNPIGTDNRHFKGTIDGQGHQIVGLYHENFKNSALSFIYKGDGFTVKNLTLKDISFGASQVCSGVCAYAINNFNISNVNVTGSITCSGIAMAGFVAHVYNTNNKLNGNAEISGCTSNIKMNVATCDSGRVGGFVGHIHEGVNIQFNNCNNLSACYSNKYSDGYAMTYDDYAGGIFAFAEAKGTTITCTNCKNFAEIKGNVSGGIAGTVDDGNGYACNLTITGCENYANVTGEDCGGILGRINDVSKSNDGKTNSKLSIYRSSNCATIGMPGAVLNNVGGLVGYISDGDLSADLDSCINYGYAANDDANLDNRSFVYFVQSIPQFILDGYNIIDDTTDAAAISSIVLASAKGALKTALIWFFVGIEIVSFIENLVVDIVTGRLFVPQYAGGIAGQFDSLASLSLNRILNMGYADGKTCSDPISPDYPSDSLTMNDVYSVDSNKKKRVYEDGNVKVEYCNVDDLVRGRIGFQLQDSEASQTTKKGEWGQVVDDGTLGVIMASPAVDTSYAKLWKHTVNGETVYSNFEHLDEVIVKDLSLEFSKDDLSTNPQYLSIPEAKGDINNLFDISVNSSIAGRKNIVRPNTVEDENTENIESLTETYSVRNYSFETIVLRPKNNNYSVTDIKIDGITNIGDEPYIESYDDGTIIKYYNPTFSSTGNRVITYDCMITYNIDSSVVIQMGVYNDIDRVINIKFTDNPVKVSYNSFKEKNQLMFPWNNPSCLPCKAGEHYLMTDINLANSTVINNGDELNLDVNGKTILLSNDSDINISDKATLNIFDSWSKSNTHVINDNNGKFNVKDTSNKETKTDTKTKDGDTTNETNSIEVNGVINKEASSSITNNEIFDVSGVLNITDVPILQNNNVVAFKSQNTANPKILLNSTVYKAATSSSDKNYATFVISNKFDNDNLYLLNDFKIVDFNKKESSLYNPDFLLGSDVIYILFNPKTNIDRPYTLSSIDSLDKVLIYNNFNNILEIDKNYSEFFKSFESDKCVALTGNDKSANNLCFAKKDICATLDIKKSDDKISGSIYPNGVINYTNGADIKVNYGTSGYNILYKVSGKYNDAVVDHFTPNDSILVRDRLGSFNYGTVNLPTNTKIDASTDNIYLSLEAHFKELKLANSSDYDYYTVVNWTSEDSLPSIATNEDGEPLLYKLENDIYLNSQWIAPVGDMAIDLNGHSIYQKTDGNCIIRLNNEKSHLIIFDNASDEDKHNNPHYFKRNSDSSYSPVDNERDSDEVIYGGVLSGVNARPVTYYTYTQDAGAIVVESGTCMFNGGTIAGNNLDSILGGAAVYVKTEGSFCLGSDARICFNKAKGEPDYKSNDFSAAVVNNGIFANEGSIDHNTSYFYAASAVVNNYIFENKGSINDNEVFYTNEYINKNDASYAVLNSNIFTNSKDICNNKSNIMSPAILNSNLITLKADGRICNNVYNVNNQTINWDITFGRDACINFDEKLNNDFTAYISSLDMYSGQLNNTFKFTKNWAKADHSIMFKVWDPSGDSRRQKIFEEEYYIDEELLSENPELIIYKKN